MAKRSGPLQYTKLDNTMPEFNLMQELSTNIRGYLVTYLENVLPLTYAVAGVYKNFMQSFRECHRHSGNSPKCWTLGVIAGVQTWLSVNPQKMPH